MLAGNGMAMDEFLSRFAGRDPHEPRDPMKAAQASIRAMPPKRFYADVSVAHGPGGWQLLLDGKPARTPARKPLALANRALAEDLAMEWRAQTEVLNPALMPLTRLTNSAIDGVAEHMVDVRAEIVRYATSDLLCYRADAPDTLVTRQSAAWDPLLAWATEHLGAAFVVTRKIVHIAQPPAAIDAVERAVACFDDALELAALSTVVTMSGSAIIALAVAHHRLDSTAAWSAQHIDEDFQIELWGRDDDAEIRRAHRWRDFEAAARILLTNISRP